MAADAMCWHAACFVADVADDCGLGASGTLFLFSMPSSYLSQLNATKDQYPFPQWAESGLEQYTEEACEAFTRIFDTLIEQLAALGATAPATAKLEAFRQAVVAINELYETDDSLIETSEREELCELCNVIAVAAGMNPKDYGDGEGPASEWRDW
jgi:hypothetical protein